MATHEDSGNPVDRDAGPRLSDATGFHWRGIPGRLTDASRWRAAAIVAGMACGLAVLTVREALELGGVDIPAVFRLIFPTTP